jgi:hypothetical protein
MTSENDTAKQNRAPAFAIDSEGTWWHEGRAIEREALVKLFSGRALCLEDGRYWLKTPHERYEVLVEDVPFLIVDYKISNPGTPRQSIEIITNLDERVTLSAENPLIIQGGPGQGVVIFYAGIRDGLRARCNRSVNYDLVAHAMEEHEGELVIRSNGAVFRVSDCDF